MLLAKLSPKLIYWTKTISRFISFQIIVQILNFASGIFIIRMLNKQEYAYFTVANSMQSVMNILANMGISSGLLSIGGQIWEDKYRFGQLINTAMQIRRYLAIIAVIIITPILFWMLISNGASSLYASCIIATILVELNFYLSNEVLFAVPRLKSNIHQLEKINLYFGLTRLVILLGAYFTYFNAVIALFASTIGSGLQKFLISSWVKKDIDIEAPICKQDRINILNVIKTCLPTTIFFCIQGQIGIWLITLFGNTQNIAEVGALGRLEVIFSLINSVTLNIISPKFARFQSRNALMRFYFQVLAASILLGILLVTVAYFVPNALLWVLGKNILIYKV